MKALKGKKTVYQNDKNSYEIPCFNSEFPRIADAHGFTLNDEQLFRNCFNINDAINENQDDELDADIDENGIDKMRRLSISESEVNTVDFTNDQLFEDNDDRCEQSLTTEMPVSQIQEAIPRQTVICEAENQLGAHVSPQPTNNMQEDANESVRTAVDHVLDDLDPSYAENQQIDYEADGNQEHKSVVTVSEHNLITINKIYNNYFH